VFFACIGVKAIQTQFQAPAPLPSHEGTRWFPIGGVMSIAGFSEFIEESSVIRMELEALSIVMAVLSCMAIMAFIVYLASVFYLWFMEGK
jgi:hypothetical protein